MPHSHSHSHSHSVSLPLSHSHSLSLSLSLSLALFLPGCPHFQPDVAVHPAPYDAASSFALADAVTYRPDLDDHRLATDESNDAPDMRTDPRELAATPALVTECMTQTAASGRGAHPILPPGVAHADAYVLTLMVTVAVPGWTRGAGDALSASASAPGGAASGAVSSAHPSAGAEGIASAILEIRATDGTLLDRVRIFAQRFPHMGEPLASRANALCEGLLDETQHYLDWRIGGITRVASRP